MKEKYNSHKPKRERTILRKLLAGDDSMRKVFLERLGDDKQSRQSRRNLATVLGLYLPQQPDIPAQGYEFKYRKTVAGYRVKPIKQQGMAEEVNVNATG